MIWNGFLIGGEFAHRVQEEYNCFDFSVFGAIRFLHACNLIKVYWIHGTHNEAMPFSWHVCLKC